MKTNWRVDGDENNQEIDNVGQFGRFCKDYDFLMMISTVKIERFEPFGKGFCSQHPFARSACANHGHDGLRSKQEPMPDQSVGIFLCKNCGVIMQIPPSVSQARGLF